LDDLTGKDVELLSMYMILFADDIVLFTTNQLSLQAQLDAIYSYSVKWGLKINVNKTKICVFEKRKTVVNSEINLSINGESIETVDDFTYLGINFTYTGNMKNAVKMLQDQALKAYCSLLSIFDRVQLDIKTKLSLFDAMVVPILLYGSEIWGVYNIKDVDKLHVRFLKNLLGVKQQTPNYAVLGEFGRFPLSILCKERAIRFWLKIMKNRNSPICNIYSDLCNTGSSGCWANRINTLIDHLDFNNIRHNFNYEINYFPSLKNKLRDIFVQEWKGTIQSMSKLQQYCLFKSEFVCEKYLLKIQKNDLLKQFARFRLSSHHLEIEVGRFQGIDRDQRLCRCCNMNVVESEYHFLLCCDNYRHLRLKFIGHISWPTLNLFQTTMSSKKINNILGICKYLKEAMLYRNNTLTELSVP